MAFKLRLDADDGFWQERTFSIVVSDRTRPLVRACARKLSLQRLGCLRQGRQSARICRALGVGERQIFQWLAKGENVSSSRPNW